MDLVPLAERESAAGCYSPRMRARFLALFLALAAASSQAQTPPVRIAPAPPGQPAMAPAEMSDPLTLTPDICRRLAAEQRAAPPAGYRPGVDVYGRPVAPADLPSAGAPTPPITTEIQLGRVGSGGAATGGRIRGYVTVAPDGNVLLNGQPLPREQEYGLFDLCRQQHLIP